MSECVCAGVRVMGRGSVRVRAQSELGMEALGQTNEEFK